MLYINKYYGKSTKYVSRDPGRYTAPRRRPYVALEKVGDPGSSLIEEQPWERALPGKLLPRGECLLASEPRLTSDLLLGLQQGTANLSLPLY